MAGTQHTIEIKIAPDGKIEGEVQGIFGPECEEISKWLDELGLVELDENTPEYYQVHAKNQQQVRRY